MPQICCNNGLLSDSLWFLFCLADTIVDGIDGLDKELVHLHKDEPCKRVRRSCSHDLSEHLVAVVEVDETRTAQLRRPRVVSIQAVHRLTEFSEAVMMYKIQLQRDEIEV